ncbi:MAG: hypothetical protein RDV48_24730 [Candidatus Eremiobacteraeota bacterium]|nr:hypothetical protein [Candidatus Eremiobacteraeota bacterium]
MRRLARGAALASLLMVVFIAVILIFSLAGTGIFHLNMSTHIENTQRARNLAESAMAQAIEKIIADQTFGLASYSGNKTIDIPGSQPRTSGMLTFDRNVAAQRGIPWSTNNLDGDVAVNGFKNCMVPPYSTHIAGIGTCRGSTCRVEAIIHVPPFPYSIASSGKFHSDGTLLVASVESYGDLPGQLSPTPDLSKLLAGNLVANGGGTDAVYLRGEARITGNLRTAGDLMMKSSTPGAISILGETICHADPMTITPLDITSYDPLKRCPAGYIPVNGGYLDGRNDSDPLKGFCRAGSDLTVGGNLRLGGCLLYVDGDLTITGRVDGSGALVSTGSTTIMKGSDLSTDNQVALLSGSDVALGTSNALDYSSFQGLIYNKGNFTADRVNLCGTFVSAGQGSSVASAGSGQSAEFQGMKLNNSRVIQVPGYEDLDAVAVVGTAPTFTVMDIIGAITSQMPPNPDDDPGQADIEFKKAQFHECSVIPVTHDYKGKQTTGYFVQIEVTDGSRPDSAFFCKSQQELEQKFLVEYCRIPAKFTAQGLEIAKRFLDDYLNHRNPPPGRPDPPPPVVSLVEINLSQFISIKDRMKVLLWRDF